MIRHGESKCAFAVKCANCATQQRTYGCASTEALTCANCCGSHKSLFISCPFSDAFGTATRKGKYCRLRYRVEFRIKSIASMICSSSTLARSSPTIVLGCLAVE